MLVSWLKTPTSQRENREPPRHPLPSDRPSTPHIPTPVRLIIHPSPSITPFPRHDPGRSPSPRRFRRVVRPSPPQVTGHIVPYHVPVPNTSHAIPFEDFIRIVYRPGDGHRFAAWSSFYGRGSSVWLTDRNLRTLWMRLVGRAAREERERLGLPAEPGEETLERVREWAEETEWEARTEVGTYGGGDREGEEGYAAGDDNDDEDWDVDDEELEIYQEELRGHQRRLQGELDGIREELRNNRRQARRIEAERRVLERIIEQATESEAQTTREAGVQTGEVDDFEVGETEEVELEHVEDVEVEQGEDADAALAEEDDDGVD
ncbi:hypothetical protein SAPIO_CDS3820 [Scedosporium apiospermum]|uniref:Uncharacterized protein n=1 Tax=Pseudallescheria apiosperma TaxID=563466 RepID=A0A084G9R1_PSEDA|nr:uncharacterized protein SAPIO_CDS3820 [Scedosporium apiospermum]KEZ44073.1 hypothetical protein SAPIO_CDS3820 [Scedosporium apiospermum]